MASNTEGTASSSGAPRAVANPSSPAKSLRAVRAPAKAAAHGSGQGGKMTVTQDELEEVREAFQLFDSEGTGFLDASELKVVLRAFGFDKKKKEVRELLAKYSSDTDDRIEYEDFKRLMTDMLASRDPTEEVRKAFDLFDEDGTGKISYRDLKRVARDLGENIDDNELRGMIEEFDLDQDGAISREEFERIMRSVGYAGLEPTDEDEDLLLG